jgi:hypothetical protein
MNQGPKNDDQCRGADFEDLSSPASRRRRKLGGDRRNRQSRGTLTPVPGLFQSVLT